VRIFNRVNDDNPNLLVGIFLLILLSVFMGPNIMPRILSSISPYIDEAMPCAWLKQGLDRANHQSLIGRRATNAIGLEIRAGGVPVDPNGTMTVDIIVINRSLGTVPFLYDATQVVNGDNGGSGLGLVFGTAALQGSAGGQTTFPEQSIRLLGPRQRCIHRAQLQGAQLDPVRQGNNQVRAFYRIASAGAVAQPAAGPTPIYSDQGLAITGNTPVQSPPVELVVNIN